MTDITPSISHIKRRVDDYLWRDNSKSTVRLRETLEEFSQIGDVYIFGGMVRDFTRKHATKFSSDIDLVLDAPPKKVSEFAKKVGAIRNRFGGFGLKTPLWRVDFWALRNTWAHQAGYVNIRSADDLLKCTFFDIDAILYDVNSRKVLVHDGYVDSILSKKIDVNLLPNPSVEGNLVRAVRRVLGWNLSPKERLECFLVNNLNQQAYFEIIQTETKLYGGSFAREYESYAGLLDAMLNKNMRVNFQHGQAVQYHLPF